MAARIPTPRHCIQHSRFTKQDGWRLWDLSLSLNGNIAVTGDNENTHRTYIDVYTNVRHSDSRDKPKIIYSKEFEKYTAEDGWSYAGRLVSFYPGSDTTILSGIGDKLEVIDLIQDRVIKSRKIKLVKHGDLFGEIRCLSVRETEIFIGFRNKSNKITVYDVIDLNEIKSIILQGIQDGYFPYDMTAIADRIFVCVSDGKGGNNYKSLIFEEKNGRILSELTKPTDTVQWYVNSVGVNMNTLGIAAVVWCDSYYYKEDMHRQIVFYSLLSENNCSFLIVEVESGVSRIRISDRGDRMITGNHVTGEVKVYDMANIFTYSSLKENLESKLHKDDCEKLIDFFAMGREESRNILNNDSPSATLLLALEEKGVIQRSSLDRLEEAFLGLKMSPSFYHVLNVYQKLRDQATSYDRFLATLSAHLTSSLPADLCDSFHISEEQKNSIISNQNPGLSLLLVLDEMGVIKPTDVGSLEKPFQKFKLVQAVAKIHEYQVLLREEKGLLLPKAAKTLEDKKGTFVEFLKKKMKSWYETMTPVPWKKSCQWKSTDLFVGSGLILTDSKAKTNVHNIDEQCKLNYKDIFSHPKLKSETRVILEGDPGAGKTMLSSQLAYDWSQGKIGGVDILIFLPLKIVEDKTLIQSIKEFYIPENLPLSVEDIDTILAIDTLAICLLLDGFEEYSTGGRMREKESSEVMKVMRKEKHSNCKVVITSRSDFAQDLPECPLLRIGRFGEKERTSYIEKLLPDNQNKQQKIKRIIQDNPFILDLCTVPLLFVLAVHNIETMILSEDGQLNKVSPFMRSMILTLCKGTILQHEVDGKRSKFCRGDKMLLGELAFNGLCKGHQQLSWQKDFIESSVGTLKPWVDSGVLVLEEGILITEKEDKMQSGVTIQEENRKKKRRKKQKEQRKRASKQDGNNDGQTENVAKDSFQLYKEGKMKDGKPIVKKKKEKEKKDKKKADEFPLVTDEMLSEEFPELSLNYSIPEVPLEPYNLLDQPSTSYKIPHIPEIPEEILTTILTEPLTTDEVPATEELAKSAYENKGDSSVTKDTNVRRAPQQVPLVVKFLHKVIQEWFAASYFCSMMRICTNKDQVHNYVYSHLGHINPTDLHYLLRFSCYIHSPSCHTIMNYLLESYRSKDGHVPQYIMNCVFLCFTEHNGVKAIDMEIAVTNVCKEVITVKSEDSRLLQQAKSSLLEYASNNEVVIEKLELEDVISTVSDTTLTLNTGVQLGILNTLKMIKVSRWDQFLQEGDFRNILALLSKGLLTKEIFCIFPSPPPEDLDECILNRVISQDVTVKWSFGHLEQTLDPRKGKWMMNLKIPGSSGMTTENINTNEGEDEIHTPTIHSVPGTSAESMKHFVTRVLKRRRGSDSITEAAVPKKIAKHVQEQPADISNVVPSQLSEYQSLLETKSTVTMNGGVLEIPNTGVVLTIPPNALPEYMEHCKIHIRIIPTEIIKEQAKSFSSNSSTVVELLPDSLKFQHPVRLTLPHCLVLQQSRKREAKIFVSHHEKESLPHWEEQTHLSYHLEDTACIILLKSLCWVKFSVDDEIVKAKKLIVYTAARKLDPQDELAEIRVGYYLDLLDQKMGVNDAGKLFIAHRKTFFFVRRKEKYPLQVSLDEIFPTDWQYHSKKPLLRDIPYEQVASCLSYSVIYTLKKKGSKGSNPLCVFTISQDNGQIPVQVAAHLKVMEKDSAPSGQRESSTKHLEQFGAPVKAEMIVTKAGDTLTISDSGVKLEIPPNAIPEHMEQCLIRMTITPSRVVEDQVTSFCSNSCTAVEISPSNLPLNNSAKLTLPHCLTFKKKKGRKARIFTNEEEGNPSPWKEQEDLEYVLKDSSCIVHLKKLCCVKYSVDENIVKAKRITLYTAAKPVTEKDELAEVEVGYYSDIPGGRELLQLNPVLEVDEETKLLFMEEQKFALELLLDDVVLLQWKCCVPSENPQEIPYKIIASSIEHSHLYVLQKESDHPGSVLCQFTASQRNSPMSSEISLQICPKEKEQRKSTDQADQQVGHVHSLIVTFQYLSERLIGSEWKSVGRILGLGGADIDHICQDNAGIQERIYEMLVLWQHKNASKATHAKLIHCLEQAKRKDLAEDIQNRKDQEFPGSQSGQRI